MRRLRVALGLVLFVPTLLIAQTPAPPPAPAAASPLPIRRVVLYKAGVGYFEHLGKVRNRQNVTIRFTSAQLDDVLKSLTTMDLGQGQITGISYNSVAPLQQRLGALRLPLDEATTSTQLLMALRGAHVEVSSSTSVATGRILGIEQRQQSTRDGDTRLVDLLSSFRMPAICAPSRSHLRFTCASWTRTCGPRLGIIWTWSGPRASRTRGA
ncbi:MAG TPA: hypothetical protein VF147_02650 [Vicinamibacterales bacterium]